MPTSRGRARRLRRCNRSSRPGGGSTTLATTRGTTQSVRPTARTTIGSSRSSAGTTRTTSSTSTRTSCRNARLVQATDVEDDRLQVAHVEHRVAPADPAPAALRAGSTAERLVCLPVVGRVVDHDVADTKVVEIAERTREAGRVHGGLETEMRVVGDGERLLVGADPDQRHDRAERLLAVDEGIDANIGDDRRLVVELRRMPGRA